jgi:hypothetical protein
VATLCSCSHFSPYYRDDRPRLVAAVDDSEVDHRLLLVGDAGEPSFYGEPTLRLLRHRAGLLPERTSVVFLGDNIYERGMPDPIEPEQDTAAGAAGEDQTVPKDEDAKAAEQLRVRRERLHRRDPGASDPGAETAPTAIAKDVEEAADVAADVADVVLPDVFESRQEAERYIDAQIDVVRGTEVRAIFLPGNHDWDQFETAGWKRILNQEDYIRRVAAGGEAKVTMLPRGGCPGPSTVPLGKHGALIALDTQWWLETRPDGKPTPENNPTGCPYTKESDVRDAFGAALESAARAKRRVIVAAHHPLATKGPHGGFADVRTHLFPLRFLASYLPFYLEWLPMPGIGSLAVRLRECCSTSPQDFSHGRNRHMRRSVLMPMVRAERAGARPLAYAAAHDHSLQIFEADRGPELFLVSGLGTSANASDVGSNSRTLFAHSNSSQPGFMEIDFLRNGAVRLAVIETTSDEPNGFEVYSLLLEDPATRSASGAGKGDAERN